MRDLQKTKKSDRTRVLLIECAISVFSQKPAKSVTFAEIARLAEITPQAIYRYFPQKRDLYFAAIGHDFDELLSSVLQNLDPKALSSLNGELWIGMANQAAQHPLATRALVSRRGPILDYIDKLECTTKFVDHLKAELELAQKLDLVRTDLPLGPIAQSLKRFVVFNQFPLLFEGKFNTPEWFESTNVILGLLFYPFPDMTAPETIEAFHKKIAAALSKSNL